MMTNKSGLVWRIILVIAMGLATTMTLLGAVGTACLAWNGQFYGPAFKWIVPYMPTYQNLVYVSLAAGVAMTLVCYAIARGDRWFYIGGLVTLIGGGGAAAVQMFYTSSLKGVAFLATPPTNIRFFITLGALILFLIVRFPGIWNSLNSKSPNGRGNLGIPTGTALIVSGFAMLTTPLWAGPSHMIEDENMVLTLIVPLLLDGVAMIVAGVLLVSAKQWLAWVRAKSVAISNQ
ncbi:MAG: hypothetical protein HZB51_29590 [Chloroflexi bacterium]|nr:hypothetical protein [Chloroflexota bacterium]